MLQSSRFFGVFLRILAEPWMKLALKLAKNVLLPLGVTADASIKKKIHSFGMHIGKGQQR